MAEAKTAARGGTDADARRCHCGPPLVFVGAPSRPASQRAGLTCGRSIATATPRSNQCRLLGEQRPRLGRGAVIRRRAGLRSPGAVCGQTLFVYHGSRTAEFEHCPGFSNILAEAAAHADRMHRSPSWCGCHARASRMKCVRNTSGGCWASERSGFDRRRLMLLMLKVAISREQPLPVLHKKAPRAGEGGGAGFKVWR